MILRHLNHEGFTPAAIDDKDAGLIHWTDGIYSALTLDMALDTNEAVFLLEKNKKDFVWHILRSFEGISVSLPQTSAILDGFTVAGPTVADILKVKRYGEAVDMLCHLVKIGHFSFSKKIACALHSIVSRDEVPDEQRGRFRTFEVALKSVSYKPPHPVVLKNMWVDHLFNDIQNPLERGVAVFLYLSRAQFFFDANKRTAMLMMNGLLISKAAKPFFIPDSVKAQFSKLLAEFYESGDADEFMRFVAELAGPAAAPEQAQEAEREPGPQVVEEKIRREHREWLERAATSCRRMAVDPKYREERSKMGF
jgi:hypothetical protein